MSRLPTAALLLGAGWSAIAGRPLTRHLFDERPYAASRSAERAYRYVQREWTSWKRGDANPTAEAFVGAMAATPVWPAVVRFIAARLAEPDRVRLEHELRYGEAITKPSPALAHHQFLAHVLAHFVIVGAVTTNYDLLAERTLRHRTMSRPPRPGFVYAGISSGPLRGASAFSVRHGWTLPSGTVPLCKLHGSLNWVETSVGIDAFADCRPAYRSTNVSYIVAPLPEREVPHRLRPVWDAAGEILRNADRWIVVGYSAPPYDAEIATWLSSASAGRSIVVHVVDPDEEVATRYEALTQASIRWDRGVESFCGRSLA